MSKFTQLIRKNLSDNPSILPPGAELLLWDHASLGLRASVALEARRPSVPWLTRGCSRGNVRLPGEAFFPPGLAC